MLTIEVFIAVLSLVLTSFGLGYSMGRRDNTADISRRNDRHDPK